LLQVNHRLRGNWAANPNARQQPAHTVGFLRRDTRLVSPSAITSRSETIPMPGSWRSRRRQWTKRGLVHYHIWIEVEHELSFRPLIGQIFRLAEAEILWRGDHVHPEKPVHTNSTVESGEALSTTKTSTDPPSSHRGTEARHFPISSSDA
jgi:hypothetical protein